MGVRLELQNFDVNCQHTGSLMAFDVFELGELSVAQTALFQGHMGCWCRDSPSGELAMPSSFVNSRRRVFEE